MDSEEKARRRIDEHPEIGVETEVGATAGRTHQQVLEATLGRERAHEDLIRGGPRPPDADLED